MTGERGRQALPAAGRPLLRLPALPRADLHQLPGEPQVRWAVTALGGRDETRLRHCQAIDEPYRQTHVV